MKSPKSALPLPRYTRRKWLASGQWAYYFEPPSWAKRQGCTVSSKDLGTDYALAVEEAETILLPAFDSWRTAGASDIAPIRASPGTFDWLVKTFKESRKYKDRDKDTRRTYDQGLDLVANYVRKSGARFGEAMLTTIDTNTADLLYEKLRFVGERERRATANAAMRSARRAWNVVARSHPKKVPVLNPFAKMGLNTEQADTPEATFEELQAFIAHADKSGRASLGTAALVMWEWAQRGEHVFGAFDVTHYRPKERPDEVRVIHPKNRKAVWVPLFDDEGSPLYPELMARLDAIKQGRIGGLMIVRDWSDADAKLPLPWMTGKEDISYARHETKRLIVEAGLRAELSLRSFRHGGITESTDAGATDEETRALTQQSSSKIMQRYSKVTQTKIVAQAKKRRAKREAK
jgi:hypothetical protein